MVTLLARLWLKDEENTPPDKVRQVYGSVCGLVGIALNILLFAGKYFAGVLSGSIAITADAFNNLSDAGSSFITLAGFRFAGKKPDPDHPFGHGRIEYISGLLVSIAIILMGFELARSSFGKILHPQAVETGILSVMILLGSIGVKLYMTGYNYRIGKKLDSAAMRATGMDSLSDTVATSVVLLSMLITRLTGYNVDGYCGVVVALFILRAGYGAAKEIVNPLLGKPPTPEFVDSVRKIVMAHPQIQGIHDLIVHDYGPGRVFLSVHAEVPGDRDIFEMHDIIDCAEQELRDGLNCEAVIHMDPIVVNDSHVAFLKKETETAVRSIQEDITIHDFRMVAGPTHTNLIFDAVIPWNLNMSDKQIKEEIARVMRERDPSYCTVVQIDKNYNI